MHVCKTMICRLVCIILLHNYTYLQRIFLTFTLITRHYRITSHMHYITPSYFTECTACRAVSFHYMSLLYLLLRTLHYIFIWSTSKSYFILPYVWFISVVHYITMYIPHPHIRADPSGLRTPSLASRPHSRHLKMTREWKETLLPVIVTVQKAGPQIFQEPPPNTNKVGRIWSWSFVPNLEHVEDPPGIGWIGSRCQGQARYEQKAKHCILEISSDWMDSIQTRKR